MGKTNLGVINDSWQNNARRSAKYCRICDCSVVESRWFNHVSNQSHVDNARKQQILSDAQKMSVSQPTFCLGAPCTITDQIRSFRLQVMQKTEDCVKVETEILNDLKRVLVGTFGNCRLHTFGSMRTGLALIGSDLDVYVEIGDFNSRNSAPRPAYEIQSKVSLCSRALKTNEKFANVNAIIDAKVPIVNAMHLPTRTKCDISFTSSLGVEQGRLLRFYFNLHPRFLDVMLMIKFWAKKQGICNGRDYISSYGWYLLFIGYLQTLRFTDGSPILPSVLELQNETSVGRKEVQGCRVDFNSDKHSITLPNTPPFSHLGLLNGFFTYYKIFSFRQDIVCPFLGMPISRHWTPPNIIHRRVIQHVADLRAYSKMGVGIKFLRIIQDPFNHKAFVVCPVYSLPKVISCISTAADLCGAAMRMNPLAKSRFLDQLFS